MSLSVALVAFYAAGTFATVAKLGPQVAASFLGIVRPCGCPPTPLP